MAETVHLFLKIAGAAIAGDSTQHSLGREGSIECFSFVDELARDERGTPSSLVRITKALDRSSPRLAEGFLDRAPVSGVFRFYRPNPSGDGTTQHYFSVAVEGQIAGLVRTSPDVHAPATAASPAFEAVTFTVAKITWTYEDGGVSAMGRFK